MPETLQPIAESTLLRQSLLFVVLFVMALPVATSELGRALKSPWGAIYASSINFLMLPALAWICSDFFFTEFLGDGLIIATVVPCTSAGATTNRAPPAIAKAAAFSVADSSPAASTTRPSFFASFLFCRRSAPTLTARASRGAARVEGGRSGFSRRSAHGTQRVSK